MIDTKSLKNIKFQTVDPELREEIREFCSSLEKEEFPEALLITSGKNKTMAGLGKIYAKLKGKKERLAQKRLQKAEEMILSLNRLHSVAIERRPPRPQEEEHGRRITALAMTSDALDRSRDRLIDLIKRIKRGEPLTAIDAIDFAQISYREHTQKRGPQNPIRMGDVEATIIMCSDSRNIIGEVIYDKNLAVESRAGNVSAGEKIDAPAIVVLGHRGYGGCGAVSSTCKCHKQNSEPEDQAMRAITTDAIPREVTTDREQNDASEANVAYQVRKIRQENPGARVYGIISNIEDKTAKLVDGEKDELSDALIRSIETKLSQIKDMRKQIAAFIVATREDRRIPGKNTLEADANEVFEVNFQVDESGNVRLPKSAEGSAKFALDRVVSVNESKIAIVMDPDPRIARTAAKLLMTQIPGLLAIPMQEKPKEADLVVLDLG
ncbi:hypothetical protein HY990_05740 [Candidatus Micrarchaeota archaeon]|nr:hypothetical protein [Candidatus Micrarchaeota archaeon]